jgi:methionyl-tRNA formyltransferase
VNEISFGTVSKFFFIGGGQSLLEAARYLNRKSKKLFIFTSPRHYDANILFDGQRIPLKKALNILGLECKVLTTFDPRSNDFDEFDAESIMMTPSAEWIFTQAAIDRFSERVVNIHGSCLPEMKGGGGVSWNILTGVSDGGATIHMVDSGIDTGDILLQKKYKFPANLSSLIEYIEFAEKGNSEALILFLERVMRGDVFHRIAQRPDSGSYWPRLKTEIHGFIDWNWSADEISRFVMAFGRPYGGAKTSIAGKHVAILQSGTVFGEYNFHPFQYGLVYRVATNEIYVAVKGGSLVIREITDLSGEKINLPKLIGHRFYTPLEKLREALERRIVFNPSSTRGQQ